MSKIVTLLKSGWFVSLVGVLLLAVLVWLLGPYVAIAGHVPLAGVPARALAVLGMLLAWGLVVLVRHLRQRARAQRMGSELAADAADGDAAAGDRAQLEARFREAIRLLRRRRGRGSLHSLPWYVVIGPPGSGKSTLIRNSGLQFPLAGHFGKEALRGVGGTRNCDWWFTDEAVFLDTAGRYTTQDSDRNADAGAWAGFLKLLRRHRRGRPLNGVLVTMSMSDLLLLDDAERDQHVQVIRRRLDELAEHLRVRVPVYLVFTKCDLVAGFGEFFDDLNPEQRSQVWGVSFPVAKTMDGSAAKQFGDEFNLLLDRINSRLIDRLHGERDRGRRAAILSFPQQFAALGDVAREFTEEVFAGHAYGPPLLLRGVYMTSGTQEGTPIDRMMGAVARTFGLDEARVHAPGAQTRTFFVERLLREVVFRESGFAGTEPAAERRKALARAACFAGIGVLAIGLVAAMAGSYMRNGRYLADVQAALAARPDVPDPSTASGMPQYFALSLQRLEGLREAMEVAQRHHGDVPLSMRAGLYQGAAVGRQLQDAYQRELNALVVPGLAAQFRRGMAANAGDLQALYLYLKGYLMLGQPAHADGAQLQALADIEWRRLFPQDPVLQAAMAGHTAFLAGAPGRIRALALDDAQVEQARSTLRSADMSALVYSGLRLGADGEGEPIRLDKELGLLGDAFVRRSGTPLSEPLPALYTRPAFAAQVGGGIERAVERFLQDDWVLGAGRSDALARARIAQQVAQLYEQDYIRAWDDLLADLQVKPAADLQEASILAAKLSGPASPLRLLLDLVRANTSDMLRTPEPDAAAQAAGAVADKARAQLAARNAALAAVLGDGGQAQAPQPGQAIAEHFATLNLLGQGAPGATPLDRTLAVLDQLGKTLLTLREFEAGQPNPQLLMARQEAAQLPPPVSGWVASLTGASEALVATGARAALGEQAREAVGADCAEFIRGRYPFDPTAQAEIPLQNFGELFGYGGRFDTLYRQSLERLIDTTGGTWRWRSGPGAVAGPAGLPAQMQLADRIKRSYFRDGNLPEVGFSLLAPALGDGLAKVVVEIDGQTWEAGAGGDASAMLRWPGPAPGRAAIVGYDAAGVEVGRIVRQGEWALFRLLQAGGLQRESDLRFVARFDLGGRSVALPVQAGNLRHPFLDTSVQRFRCGGGA
ncbi:type VI secretion system membrane subunit TssM [Coralloluteibacterium thermophilus]|uniref:Type VI secretion system membrane subunit TssM n=1 Tax=Coralloluteibacterium thermophilum TaxID=2707049 RepID=A0ABV9NS21_9GAMM